MIRLGRFAAEYRDTWRESGAGGQAILLGTFLFLLRGIGFSFLMPLYAKASGFSTEQYGLLFAIQNITPIVALVPILILARRGWDRRLMMLGPAIGFLGLVTFVVARDYSFGYWAIGAILVGFSGSTYWTLSDPLLAEATTHATRPRAYALKWLFFILGSSAGALIAGVGPEALRTAISTSELNSYWSLLIVLAVFELSQVWVFRRAPVRQFGRHASSTGEAHLPIRSIAISLVLFGTAEATFGMGYNVIRPFMSLFLTERQGMSSGTAGALIASTAIFAAVGGLLMPVLGKTIGNSRSLALLRFSGAMAVAAWFAVENIASVAMLTLLYYGLMDGTSALYAAEIMGRLPAASRDLMAGVNNVMWSVVAAGSAWLSGYLQDLPGGGFGLAFSVGITGYMLSAIWCLLILPRIRLRSLLVPAG